MNEQKLIQNVIEQIKEAQLKLGAEKEVIRLYFPMASMNALLGTHYTDEQEMLVALRTNTVFDTTVLGRLKFFIHEGRFEVRVPAEGAEYVAGEIPDPPFLKAIVELFAHHHSLTIEEICACFAQFDKAYHCEKMAPGTDFDYAVYFDDAEYDAYYYCVKMEMGHTIYHRFTKEDYQMLID